MTNPQTPQELRQQADKILGDAVMGALAGIWAGPYERRRYKIAVKKARQEHNRLKALAAEIENNESTAS